MKIFLTTLVVLSGVAIGQNEPPAEVEVDPYEWVVESYRFPDDRVTAFASEERGELVAPPMPGANAKPEAWREFIRKSSSVVTHYLERGGLALPEGALVIFDPESQTLAARLPRISQSSVAFTSDSLVGRVTRYISTDHVIFEAPAGRVRRLLDEGRGKIDQTDMLEALEAMVDSGDASVVASGKIDTRSGQRSKIQVGEDRAIPVDFELDTEGNLSFDTEVVFAGTVLEMDPVIGNDGETIDFNYALKHHFAPAVEEKVPVVLFNGEPVTANQAVFSHANMTSAITLKGGMSALLGVWSPQTGAGEGAAKFLQVAFLSAGVVEVLPLPNPKLVEMLREHGDAVAPIPEGKLAFEKEAEEVPEGMIVRRFRIAPDFIDSGGPDAAGDAVVDPFAPSHEPRFTIQATAKDILMARGVSFPKGASANFLANISTLVIRNTPENIALVEAYVMDLRDRVQRTMSYTVHIVEGPAGAMREVAKETRFLPDHTEVWEQLQKQNGVQVLDTSWIDSRSGQRCQISSGRLRSYPVGVARSAGEEDTGENFHLVSEEALEGMEIELDGVIGTDGKTLDVNFAIVRDLAPPTVGELELGEGEVRLDAVTTSFHEARVTLAATMLSGSMRMLGLWDADPFGNGERTQAVFLRAELAYLDEDAE